MYLEIFMIVLFFVVFLLIWNRQKNFEKKTEKKFEEIDENQVTIYQEMQHHVKGIQSVLDPQQELNKIFYKELLGGENAQTANMRRVKHGNLSLRQLIGMILEYFDLEVKPKTATPEKLEKRPSPTNVKGKVK